MLDLLPGTGREPADCVIKLGTPPREIGELYPLLAEVTVECTRTQAWAARLKFQSFRDESGSWRVQADPAVAAWQPIEITARFGRTDEDLLKGYVREVKAEYPEDAGRANVTVDCQDASLKLDAQRA